MASSEQVTIEIQCQGGCGGTGIYCGWAEPKGVGVICGRCRGTGKQDFTYTPFTERKLRKGIKRVYLGSGGFLVAGVGPKGEAISYKEFLEGKFPVGE